MEDINISQIVTTHLGSHGKVAYDNVFPLLHIVIEIESIGVAPLTVVAVFLVVKTLAIPIVSFNLRIFSLKILHLIGSESVVGGAKIDAQLIHRARFHLDVIRQRYGESLPLRRIRIVDLEAHFFLQTARLAHTVGLVQLIVLQERKDVVVENSDDSQCHRIKADGIKIDGGLLHVGDDNAIVGPTHLWLIVGQLKPEGIFGLQHLTRGTADACADRHLHLLHLIVVETRLIEIEVYLIILNVRFVTNRIVERNQSVEVLTLFQCLGKIQRSLSRSLVNIENHRPEITFGINGQVIAHGFVGFNLAAIQGNFQLGFCIFSFNTLNLNVINIISYSIGLDLIGFPNILTDELLHIALHWIDKSDAKDIIHLVSLLTHGIGTHKADVLAAHRKTKLHGYSRIHIEEVADAEVASVALVRVDVVVLESDRVFINPNGLALQGRLEVEGFGGDGLAIFHLQRFGVFEAHHDGFAFQDGARSEPVNQRQQGFIQRTQLFYNDA